MIPMKIVDKVKKCCIGKLCLSSFKRSDKKWDFPVLSLSWEFWKIEWSVAIWIDKNKNIALIKDYRHAIDKISWELPRWWVEKWINSVNNAVKEFQEEIWIQDEPLSKRSLAIIAPETWFISASVDMVLLEYEDFAKYIVWWEKDGSYEDIYEVNYFSVFDFEDMILNGEIVDNYTISAYGLLKLYKII